MQTLLLTILVLGVLVFVHELGHFLTAKWAGIGVPRFSIGLGPRVVGVRVGETDYCLSAIPFGGYVKMAGMEGEEAFEGLEGGAENGGVAPEKRFESKTIAQRLVVISAGVAMNFLLGWAIYVGLIWNNGIPVMEGTIVAAVDSTALQEHPVLARLEGDTIATIDGQPVANWYEISEAIEDGDGPLTIGLWSDEVVQIPLGDEEDRREVAGALIPLVVPVIAEMEADGPAARAGLREGDRIVSIDGVETQSFADVSDIVRARPGQVVPIVVERGVGQERRRLSFDVHAGTTSAPRAGDGRFVDIGWLGVGTRVGRIELSPVDALVAGTEATWRASTLIVGGLYQLVTGDVSLRSLGGPVAIGQLTGLAARQGVGSLFAWVALFSINLAILNLLPIPVLDGGHILFLAIEGSRGRPLSNRQKMRLSQVGLAFLVLLMAWAFTADILRLLGF
jgi:regulator of sigma E protease